MLYDKLKKYSNSGIYPFHMPGHKRNNTDISNILPYGIDLTEINGFDNLHNASGCIKELEQKTANAYSVNNAFLLVNGATGGILASIRAMTNYGDTIIMARNCHKSVYNAIEICGLNPVYVQPETDDEFGIFSSVAPSEIENQLIKNPNASLVILTSPTYEGVVSDIKAISKICKKYCVKLFVDEAHGAHFPFCKIFPEEAVKCGADAAVVSLHKTLPSLTQTALLLTDDINLSKKFEENLSVFETSSPSYILMSSIENCIEYICDNPKIFDTYADNLKNFNECVKSFETLKILCFGSDSINNHSFFNFDIGKIIISTAHIGINGTELANILREKYKIETEMAYGNYVLAMTSVCDTKEGFDRLSNALISIDKDFVSNSKINKSKFKTEIPKKQFNASQRYKYKAETVALSMTQGRTSLEYVWAYPPGVPLLVPGEIITDALIEEIAFLIKTNTEIFSNEKNMPESISVAVI